MASSYGQLRIKRTDGQAGTGEVDLAPGPNSIGRVKRPGRADELVLDHPQVSADHAIVTAVETGCYITDLGSQNGTFLNDEDTSLEPQRSRLLRYRDSIRIGPYQLVYTRTIAVAASASWRSSPQIIPPEVAARQPHVVAPIDLASLRHGLHQPVLNHPTSDYMQYLPGLYHTSNLINDLLLSCEAAWQPIEAILDALHWYCDPRIAPADMLPWLAAWLGITIDANWTIAQQRLVIANAIKLLRWRGTRQGLIDWIELLTGLRPIMIEVGQEPALQPPLAEHEFCLIFEQAEWDRVDAQVKDLVERIIQQEKPIQTTHRIESRSSVPAGH